MPLFCYKCPSCDFVIEKFQHNSSEIDILCEECHEKCIKIINSIYNIVLYNAKENYEKNIIPNVNKIIKNIQHGSDKDFLDITGE